MDARVPSVGLQRFDTHGTIARVAGPGDAGRRVNAALVRVVIADQRAWAPGAVRARRRLDTARPRSVYAGARGRYVLGYLPHLASASSVVVSVLLTRRAEVTTGVGAEDWLGMTVDASTGAVVPVDDLFVGRVGDVLDRCRVAV